MRALLMTAECQSLRRCVAYAGGPATPRLDGGPLCDGCLWRARYDIAALPADHLALTAELVPAGGAARDAHVSGGDPDAPVPLALAVDELQRRIAWTLTAWEPAVREALGLPPAADGRVRPSWAVANASRLLAAHVRTLAALGPTWGYADGLDAGPVERDGLYAVDSLRRVHDLAQRTLGLSPQFRALPGTCSGCGGAGGLLREDGSDRVCCQVCGTSESFDSYRRGYAGTDL